jgi:putative Mg2+ transporter-C (MgtC) family protein
MISNWELVLRLLVAAGLGSLIGAERERLVWAAGLRTHMLVSVGACLFMIVSAFGFADILGTPNVVLDPSRVAAQVVSGIGFLGAGSILLRGDVVRGLTTAASLWTVAAIGLAVGGGLYLAAVAATIVILVILAGIKPLERRLQQRSQPYHLVVRAKHGKLPMGTINDAVGYRSRRISLYTSTQSEDPDIDEIGLTLIHVTPEDVTEIVDILKRIPDVREVERT